MMYAVFLVVGVLLGFALGWLASQQRSRGGGGAHAQGAVGSVGSVESVESAAGKPELTQAAELRKLEQLESSIMPLHQALGELAGSMRALETDRGATLSGLSGLTSQVQAMVRSSHRLTQRTDRLVAALRAPQVRGRWGEIQLERVVELGGMVEHCDFDTQQVATVGGRTVKPDLVVHLSGGRQIVVDAKVPFGAYLDAIDSEDPEEHAAFLRRHAHQLRSHVNQLSARDYVGAFHPTPEFVVLFVPADPFLDAALNADPELLEYAFGKNVVIATPTTLFALLRTVALSWQQSDFSEKARTIHRLGRELYGRIGTMSEHYDKVGRSLEKAIEAYNSTLSSMQSRVLVTARRLSEMEVPAGNGRHTPPEIDPVMITPRHPDV